MKYTKDGRYRYDHDELVQTWVTHNLYVIGEAARAIASDFPDFKGNYSGTFLSPPVAALEKEGDFAGTLRAPAGRRSPPAPPAGCAL